MYQTILTSVAVKKMNDVMRLQALVYKKKVIITEATIRDDLWLDDAEGIECLPNEEIFTELSRMGYEKSSTMLTFYKAFFSPQWKFLIHTILQCTPLFKGMIVAQEVGEGAANVNVEYVPDAGVVAEGTTSVANDDVNDAAAEPSIPSPTPPTQPPPPSQDIPSTSQGKKVRDEEQAKVFKLRRLKKVGTTQRIDTSDDTVMDDEVAVEKTADAVVKESVDIQGWQAESQAQISQIDLEHANKVLSMQDEESEPAELQEVVEVVTTAKLITKVVTAASETITAADIPIPAATITAAASTLTTAPTTARRRKGVVIKDPEKTSTPSIIIHTEPKSKEMICIIINADCKPIGIPWFIKGSLRHNLRHVSKKDASYFITFNDDYSRYCYVYLLKYKHEVFETFKDYALESAARILNMVPTKKVDKTPYELWHRKVPKLSYLKESGRIVELEDEDNLPSKNTSKHHIKEESLALIISQEEDVIPVRRSDRTHKAPDRLSVKSKWICKKKRDMDGKVHIYKARLVAKGCTQTYGVDYGETFSPVANIRASRILIAIAAYYDYEIWQMDVKIAFLNGFLEEEIYMEQLEGFIDPNRPRKASGSNVIFLILYVDDIILMGNHIPSLQKVKTYLGKCFSMKDLGETAFILGIKIYRDRSRRLIGLSQNAYLDKILKRYRMDNSKRAFILMQVDLYLSKSQCATTSVEMKRMQNIPYASASGSIMYVVRCTRPKVAFTQNITNRFRQNSSEAHWTVVKNILKYLINTNDTFLVYGGAVVWKSSKQSTTAHHATKAEYIAASEAAKEAIWIRKFIDELGVNVEERLVHYKKNEDVLTDKINVLNFDVQLRDKVLAEYTKKLEKAEKQRDELKLILEKLQNSSKSLNALLENQVSDKDKTGLGYKAASSAVEGFVNSSKILEKQENKSDKGYHEVLPPFTGNYMPPKRDLRLIDRHFESESVDVSTVSSSDGKTVKTIDVKGVVSKEEPKPIKKNKFSPPIVKDWVSESEEEYEPKFQKQVQPSFPKIKFVKAKDQNQSFRKPVKQAEQAKSNTHRPRGNQRN
uniref:Reverse transcriptase Ty1/copia-type domain-containing protein n=1 Tax=Tanacetum cinerariifolium TaxID=118510 RepID=A0A6L2M5C7_TANCI|nr:hypothetical protein [Tanacetum cinerariifolium]